MPSKQIKWQIKNRKVFKHSIVKLKYGAYASLALLSDGTLWGCGLTGKTNIMSLSNRYNPNTNYEYTFHRINGFGSNQIAPFNSQNTFLSREVLPYYAVLPHVGRMDDIWGAYIVQHYFPDSVIYNKATVYQDRNLQDLITNLENEII